MSFESFHAWGSGTGGIGVTMDLQEVTATREKHFYITRLMGENPSLPSAAPLNPSSHPTQMSHEYSRQPSPENLIPSGVVLEPGVNSGVVDFSEPNLTEHLLKSLFADAARAAAGATDDGSSSGGGGATVVENGSGETILDIFEALKRNFACNGSATFEQLLR